MSLWLNIKFDSFLFSLIAFRDTNFGISIIWIDFVAFHHQCRRLYKNFNNFSIPVFLIMQETFFKWINCDYFYQKDSWFVCLSKLTISIQVRIINKLIGDNMGIREFNPFYAKDVEKTIKLCTVWEITLSTFLMWILLIIFKHDKDIIILHCVILGGVTIQIAPRCMIIIIKIIKDASEEIKLIHNIYYLNSLRQIHSITLTLIMILILTILMILIHLK